MSAVPTVLLVGGLDSSGEAGLLRDVQALNRFGVRARVVLTAVTAQTDQAVLAVQALPAALLRAQIEAARRQGPLAAIKLGMLVDAATVATLAAALPDDVPWVLDPVLAASSGAALLDDAGRDALCTRLLPRVALLTPNLPELQLLAAQCGILSASPVDQVAALLARAPALLVKGGHASGRRVIDRLYRGDQPVQRYAAPRQPFALRGTGCLLASLIAAALATGNALEPAVRMAHARLAELFASEARARGLRPHGAPCDSD